MIRCDVVQSNLSMRLSPGQYWIERDALLKLYHNTNGPGWTQKWDITSSDHCSWHGVTCTSGVVTML